MLRHATKTSSLVVISIVLGALGLGCESSHKLDGLKRGDDPSDDPGSGSNPWTGGGDPDDGDGDGDGDGNPGDGGDPSDPSCTRDLDCLKGEICLNKVCQMQRCTTYGNSAAPIGKNYTFFWDRELVVSDDSNWLNGYAPDVVPVPNNLVGGQNYWNIGSAQILDVVGGNLLEGAPDEIAVSEVGRNVLTVINGQDTITFDLGFNPLAISAADFDQDGLDELVAVGKNGGLAICHVADNKCDLSTISGISVVDATAGDVDSDGYAELVILFEKDASRFFYVLNNDYKTTTQEQVIITGAPGTVTRIAAGDINGDGTAEVFGLEDNVSIGYPTNALVVFQLLGAAMPSVASASVAWDATDIAVSNFGGQATDDHGDSVAVVRKAGYVDVFDNGVDNNTLTFSFSAPLYNIGAPARVAFVDYDGDSPRGKLVQGPTPVPGNIIPTMVMQLPPYDREHSSGTSSVSVGNGSSSGQTHETSISYTMGISVGVSGNLFDVFSGGVSRNMSYTMSRWHDVNHTVSVGSNFSMGADPSKFGVSLASVVLASGCFLNFVYDIEDPTGKLVALDKRTADGKALFSVLVPVGGQSALWAVDRYNAMARKVGGLPIIPTSGFRSGDLTSYSSVPLGANGKPVPASDFVFPSPPTYTVSDVGSTSWSVSVSDNDVNAVNSIHSVGTSINEGLLGFNYGQNAGQSWANNYFVNVGKSASFGGTIPPIPNKLGTPSDEYLLYRYSFQPYVYMQHYTDANGDDAAYYMITYTVGK